MVLLGKPSGGQRTIALIAMLARLVTRVGRTRSRAWCKSVAGHWDQAIAGSSALRSHMLFRLRQEVDICRDRDWALVL